MNKLEINIPNGMEIDWQESAKQEKIVFKEKQLTYEDVCKKLFSEEHYCINTLGQLKWCLGVGDSCPNNATSKHQLECILAKNKLANVARYLNGDWKWKWGSHNSYLIMDNSYEEDRCNLQVVKYTCYTERFNILFETAEKAKQAIEILGEETVKLALTPLY